ncbi:hypothetical protein [Neisseria iguanae]|uniref:Uncharacterized protein n=1 Tax=Neisseria iguanae TaxID=90242 RepID=A0A2P7TWT0_9NEIS|nr:hypothetical protein [Neisseria iguanae]PSJ79189.1 hypothetical protein C7N83_13770 [Neisseria iguanae]
MAASDVEAIIADTFRLTGIKLTADDPIIAVLVMQQHRINQAFKEQQVEMRPLPRLFTLLLLLIVSQAKCL